MVLAPAVLTLASRMLLLSFAAVGSGAFSSDGKGKKPSSYDVSEEALRQLVGVAELRVGVTVFRYEADDAGRYVPTYESSVCPLPGASRLQALRAAGHGEVERDALSLRPLADMDGSGVVSDEEAVSLARLVDLGFRLNGAVRLEGPSGEKVAQVMGVPTTELLSQVREYESLTTRGKQLGIVLAVAPALDWNKP